MSGEPRTVSRESHPFLSRRFDVHSRDGDSARSSQIFTHLRNMCRHFGLLRNDGAVDILDPEAELCDDSCSVLEQGETVYSVIFFCGIGVVSSDVSFPCLQRK